MTCQSNSTIRINFPVMESLIARVAGVKALNQVNPKSVIGFTSHYNKAIFYYIRIKENIHYL